MNTNTLTPTNTRTPTTGTPQTPGMDSIASPDNDFGNDVVDDDWHLHDMNEEDDDAETNDLGEMLQRARLEENDDNGGDSDSSGEEEEKSSSNTLQIQISDEDPTGGGDDDEDMEGWANFGDFDENVKE